ncbi:hypothetical protein BDZ91DRAFT_775634 [Kalaharituber pfeilii]|nr:hypothetical protein BDZ91DRAFT_775634 [Kalaharituber pfeilii]
MNHKIFLITGTNKGIGFGIVRSLLFQAPPGSIINLTARDTQRGENAASCLLHGTKHGKLDMLINNASMPLKEAEQMIAINYHGTLNVHPFTHPCRIVNISVACHLSFFTSPSLRARISSPTLTIAKLSAMMESYLTLLRNGVDPATEGWPDNCYSNPDKIINCCCPGWGNGEGGPRPPKSLEESARIPVRLAVGDS